jgi:hypothetical protein
MSAAVSSPEPLISARQPAEFRQHVQAFGEYVITKPPGSKITIEDVEQRFSRRQSILAEVVVERCFARNDLEAQNGIVGTLKDINRSNRAIGYERTEMPVQS